MFRIIVLSILILDNQIVMVMGLEMCAIIVLLFKMLTRRIQTRMAKEIFAIVMMIMMVSLGEAIPYCPVL